MKYLGITIDCSKSHCAIGDIGFIQRLLLRLIDENLSESLRPHFASISMICTNNFELTR